MSEIFTVRTTDAVGTAMKNTIDNQNSHARTHDHDRKIDIQDDALSSEIKIYLLEKFCNRHNN